MTGSISVTPPADVRATTPVLEVDELAVVFVLVNLLVDISYGLLDPRVRVR